VFYFGSGLTTVKSDEPRKMKAVCRPIYLLIYFWSNGSLSAEVCLRISVCQSQESVSDIYIIDNTRPIFLKLTTNIMPSHRSSLHFRSLL